MPLLLCLESTCDETAAAIVRDDLTVLGSAVASQEELHERFRGVVPEIAARAHLERFLPIIDAALDQAGVTLQQLDYIAVANTPGLAGSLLMGVTVAKTLALALGKPLAAINHLQAHIYACRMAAGCNVFPCVGLIVSGGHTSLYRCRTPVDFELLGGTIDDAAGEAFDKAASLLGLPFPGGPALAAAAERGNPAAHHFPRSLVGSERLDFSFSGLKTAVRYAIWGPGKPITGPPPLTAEQVCDLAASFQEAVVDSLISRTRLALERTKLEHALRRRRRGRQSPLTLPSSRTGRRVRNRASHRAPRALHRQRRHGRHRLGANSGGLVRKLSARYPAWIGAPREGGRVRRDA
jgi:N6-L-threonylcarbamoyladenine synthase